MAFIFWILSALSGVVATVGLVLTVVALVQSTSVALGLWLFIGGMVGGVLSIVFMICCVAFSINNLF